MSDKFWCLVCGANVEGEKKVREFPSGEKVMKLTTVHCEKCGLALVRSSTMREKDLEKECENG